MIRALIFDCLGVFYLESYDYLRTVCPVGSRRQIDDLTRSLEYGYITTAEYIDQVAAISSISRRRVEEILDLHYLRNDKIVQAAVALKAHYKIALLSNINTESLSRFFTRSELAQLFDAVVLSGQEGIAKPQPAIFMLTAERLGVEPEECVMIDDSAVNCHGAETTGMQSILYRDHDDFLARVSNFK